MLEWSDSNWVRVMGYALVAVSALFAGVRERRRRAANPNLWPVFWYLTAGVFLLMAAGRLADIGGLATELGRSEAYAYGWYAERRKFQAVLVGGLCATWFVAVVIALWRVPERRRRYLPMAVVTFSLMCFAAIRLVSLHQVDGLLYRREIEGAPFGSVVELAGIMLAFATTFWHPRYVSPRAAEVDLTSAAASR